MKHPIVIFFLVTAFGCGDDLPSSPDPSKPHCGVQTSESFRSYIYDLAISEVTGSLADYIDAWESADPLMVSPKVSRAIVVGAGLLHVDVDPDGPNFEHVFVPGMAALITSPPAGDKPPDMIVVVESPPATFSIPRAKRTDVLAYVLDTEGCPILDVYPAAPNDSWLVTTIQQTEAQITAFDETVRLLP